MVEPPDGPYDRLSPDSIRFLDAIGVDPKNPADLRKLRDTLRWADEEQVAKLQRSINDAIDLRERRAARRTQLYGLGFGAMATAIGSVITWIIAHTSIGLGH